MNDGFLFLVVDIEISGGVDVERDRLRQRPSTQALLGQESDELIRSVEHRDLRLLLVENVQIACGVEGDVHSLLHRPLALLRLDAGDHPALGTEDADLPFPPVQQQQISDRIHFHSEDLPRRRVGKGADEISGRAEPQKLLLALVIDVDLPQPVPHRQTDLLERFRSLLRRHGEGHRLALHCNRPFAGDDELSPGIDEQTVGLHRLLAGGELPGGRTS
jgi:hypothetical protein